MLPALPVEATGAREADMAGARKGALPADKVPADKVTAKPSAEEASADEAPAAEKRAAGGSRAVKRGGRAARRSSARTSKGGGGNGAGDATPQATAADLPVREGEHQWTPEELAEVRAGLGEQIEALRKEIAAAASQIAEGDTSDGAGDDQADAGAKTYAREHELALSYNSRDLLAQMERAVQRMDAGTYGICESCAKPIGKARLQVFPRATLCVTCKQREERR